MSEKATEAPVAAAPKKKGKLPIIVALVAVLGGGGYFMMKPKPAKPTVKVIELAKAPEDIKEEFLVNLSGSGAYLRTEISLWMSKDFHGKIEEEQAVVKDCILDVLSTATVEDMRGERLKALKKAIAARLNEALAEDEHKEEPKEEPKKKNQVVVEEEHKDDHKEKGKGKEVEVPKDWDSTTGPVLRILFRSKAWQ